MTEENTADRVSEDTGMDQRYTKKRTGEQKTIRRLIQDAITTDDLDNGVMASFHGSTAIPVSGVEFDDDGNMVLLTTVF